MIKSLLRTPPLVPCNRFPSVFLPHGKIEQLVKCRRTHIDISLPSSSRDHRRPHAKGAPPSFRLRIDPESQPSFDLLSADCIKYSSFTSNPLKEDGESAEQQQQQQQNFIFELRDTKWKSLLGYALLDDDPLRGRRLIAFDFLGPEELRTRTISEEFWASRVRKAVARRRQQFRQRADDSSVRGDGETTTALRLIHGSADGLPHVFVDQLGASAFSVGCNSRAASHIILPAVIRAIEQQLRPMELLVAVKRYQQTKKEKAAAANEEDASSVPAITAHVTTELVSSDLHINNSPSLLQGDATCKEFGVTFPRIAGSALLPFDIRARGLRRFLREVAATGKHVVAVDCDVATTTCLHEAACASLLLFFSSESTTSTTRLVQDTQKWLRGPATSGGGDEMAGTEARMPHVRIIPAAPSGCPPDVLSSFSAESSTVKLLIFQLGAGASSAAAMLKPLQSILAERDCFVVFIAPKVHQSSARWVDDDEKSHADVGDNDGKEEKEERRHPLQAALDDCRENLWPTLRVVKLFDSASLPDFPISSGSGWNCSNKDKIIGAVCVF